jgi:2'-hydroxyisoflavone reductase
VNASPSTQLVSVVIAYPTGADKNQGTFIYYLNCLSILQFSTYLRFCIKMTIKKFKKYSPPSQQEQLQPIRNKMRLLILGGTSFVGRAAAMEAVARGHDVTTFNRGTRSTPEGAKSIIGDRLAPDGYKGLEGLSFDSVLDTWAYDAEVVKTGVSALKGRISHFTYISSVAVYDESHSTVPISEDSPLVDIEKPGNSSKYSLDKRGGELEALKSGVPVLLPRPGIILGPYESFPGRLPWWLNRMRRGGRTLAPGPKENLTQFIDVRDLACFVIDATETRASGIYNTISKPTHTTMGELVDTLNDVTGRNAELVWKDPETILEAGVKPWSELPCWLPPGPEHDLKFGCSVDKAIAAGLDIRPMTDTVVDTWAWLEAEGDDLPNEGIVGLDPEKEAKILQ